MNIIEKVKTFGTLTKLFCKNHKSELLSVGCISGYLGSVITASRSSLKLEEVLKKSNDELDEANALLTEATNEQLDNNTPETEQKVKECKKNIRRVHYKTWLNIGKLYGIPAVLFVTSSVVMWNNVGSLKKENAMLTTALGTAYTTLNNYRERVRKELGEEKERDIYNDVKEVVQTIKTPEGQDKTVVTKVPQHLDVFDIRFDPSSVGFDINNVYTLQHLESANSALNDLFEHKRYLLVIDVIKYLQIPLTNFTQEQLWYYHNYGWVVDVEDPDIPKTISFGLRESKLIDGEYKRVYTKEAQEFLSDRSQDWIILHLNCTQNIITPSDGHKGMFDVIQARG